MGNILGEGGGGVGGYHGPVLYEGFSLVLSLYANGYYFTC